MSLMQKQTVAEVIVDSLLRHGVEVMFSQSLPSAVLLVPGLTLRQRDGQACARPAVDTRAIEKFIACYLTSAHIHACQARTCKRLHYSNRFS